MKKFYDNHKPTVITYIVARITYSIFQTQYFFSARSLTYEMLRWAFFMDHDYICGLLYSPMSGLSLRTLRFEDWCSHLVITEQLLMTSFISVFSHWQMMFQMDYMHDYDSAFIILCYGYHLLLYSSLWHVLTCSVMIWRS